MDNDLEEYTVYCNREQILEVIKRQEINDVFRTLILHGFDISMDEMKEVYIGIARRNNADLCINIIQDTGIDSNITLYIDSSIEKSDEKLWEMQKKEMRDEIAEFIDSYDSYEVFDYSDYTQEEISNLVGASRPAIANALRLLTLPEEIISLVSKKELSAGHARALLTLEDDESKVELAKFVIKEDISVRETERLARKQIKTEPTGKKTKKRNPYYDEVELALSDVLQRKVRVTKSTKKGAIEIEFFDDEDLKKLIKIFDNE
jgi:hypothetical protein